MLKEIEKRKNTTKTGLKSLEKLMKEISEKLNSDIQNIKSDSFFCKYSVNNGYCSNDIYYHEWNNTKAVFKIIDGELKLFSVSDCDFKDIEIDYIQGIFKIDFKQCSFCLTEILKNHLELSIEKDKQIEDFLKFAGNF